MLVMFNDGSGVYLQVQHNQKRRKTVCSLWAAYQVTVVKKDVNGRLVDHVTINENEKPLGEGKSIVHKDDQFVKSKGTMNSLTRAIDDWNKKFPIENDDRKLTRVRRIQLWDKVFNGKFTKKKKLKTS